MARRDDLSRDLLFGLIALERGLVDRAQLVAAFNAWSDACDRTMPEILLGQGALDEPGRALLDGLVQGRLARRERKSNEGAGAGAVQRGRDEDAALGDVDLSATVSHPGSPLTADDPDRTTGWPRGFREGPALGDRYSIIRPHARGGLGEVFIALDPELDRQVALKELRAYHAHDPVSQSRFVLEAKVTGRLEHPGIVPVYGLGRYADGRPYYAMRFIEGETLKQAIERFHKRETAPRQPREREIAFRRLLRSVIDACNAVAYAHSRGVVHRDLKPDNIMLGRFGETLVVDWGIAKPQAESTGQASAELAVDFAADEPSLTRPGSAVGTPQYMSPEQAAGDLERVGPGSDVYSLGATLYCVLAGHGPFPSGRIDDVLERVRRGIFPGPRRVRRSIDPTLETICLKAMSLRPEDRYASPLGLAEEIEGWLADVRFRGEQERAHHDVSRSLARLCIERAQNLFGREMISEGMLWLARALENIPPDSADMARAIRASLGGWHSAAKLLERCLSHSGPVHGVVFSPDGRSLATASADRTARLWDVSKGTPLSPAITHKEAVRAIAVSPDGRLAATASDDGLLLRWDAVTGAAIGRPIRLGAPVVAVRFSPDGSKITTASRSGIPCLWDAATGSPITGAAVPEANVLAVAFDPSGSRFATADEDGVVQLREATRGTLLGQSLRHEAAVPSVAFSPDGARLVSGCVDGRARIWDTESCTVCAEFLHSAAVGCVEFGPDGRTVLTGYHDGTARIWNATTNRPIGEPLLHRGRVDCLAFSPDGTIVAVGTPDGSVRLWDANTGLPIGPPLEHRGAVHALAFSPDSRRLATACSDGKARCWRIPVPIGGDAERIACWVRVTTGLEFDEGDAIGQLDQLAVWELRRRLYELGGPPVK
jgi:WD40 repeat protein/tRNA A-37 threonylcarbamoyl transferase component Bud32